MRRVLPIMAVLAVAACSPQVPDSAAGVGFGDYDDYQAQREADLAGARVPETTVRPPQTSTAPTTAQAPAQTTIQPAPPVAPQPTRVVTSNPGISDEQDFNAVSSRESIESDAARRQARREQYQVVEPTALPTRSGGSAPNIVQYALSTTNRLGQQVYSRSKLRLSDYNRNCVRYPSSDKAQEAFLQAGGPKKDKHNIDPDGDGFACDWDPTPFRAALSR